MMSTVSFSLLPLRLASGGDLAKVLLCLLILSLAYLTYKLFTTPQTIKQRNARATNELIGVGPSSAVGGRWLPALFPGLGQTVFYSKRIRFVYDHLGDPTSASPTDPAPPLVFFNILSYHVALGTSHAFGKTFFHSRSVDFSKGYTTLFAGVPSPPSAPTTSAGRKAERKGENFLATHLRVATNTKRLGGRLLQDMVGDCVSAFGAVEDGGLVDCWDMIHKLVFHLSIRTVGLAEHARDLKTISKMSDVYWMVENNTGFFATLFPYLPFPSSLKRLYGAISLYRMISSTLAKRVEEGRREEDYVQVMLDKGVGQRKIVQWIIGALFAAIVNSTGMAAWLLVHVGADPALRRRVRREVVEMVRRSAEERGEDFESMSLAEHLGHVPLDTWERSLELVDSCLKETMRRYVTGVAFRYYGGVDADDAVSAQGLALQPGDYLAYWLGGTHLSFQIYSNPTAFDADRWSRGEGKGEDEFLGWGTGLHPCLGMRFAKLEVRIVTAAFVASFSDFEAVDPRDGTPYAPETVPKADEVLFHYRPPVKPVRLRCKRGPE